MTTSNPPLNRSAASNSASDQVTNLAENAAQGAHQTVDRVAEKAAPMAAKLHSGIDRAHEAVQDGLDQFDTIQQEWKGSARAQVREHPLLAVAAAVAAGLLISRIIAR